MCTQGQLSPNQLRSVEVLSKPCSCSTARGGTGERCCLCYEHLPYFITFRKELVRVHPKLFGAKHLNPAKGRVMLHTQSSEGKTFLASLHPISSPPSKPVFTFLKNRDRSRLTQSLGKFVSFFSSIQVNKPTHCILHGCAHLQPWRTGQWPHPAPDPPGEMRSRKHLLGRKHSHGPVFAGDFLDGRQWKHSLIT